MPNLLPASRSVSDQVLKERIVSLLRNLTSGCFLCLLLSADVCAASGQQVNFEKSVRFSSPNTKCDLARAISRERGFPLTSNLGADSRKTF